MARHVDPVPIMATGFALGGLITMMVAPAPSWGTVAGGVMCLFMFIALMLVPRYRARPHPRRSRVRYAIIEETLDLGNLKPPRELSPWDLAEYPTVRDRIHPWRPKGLHTSRQLPHSISARSK